MNRTQSVTTSPILSQIIPDPYTPINYVCNPSPVRDYNNYRHATWENTTNACYEAIFSNDTVRLISNKVTELTMGLDEKGRKIVVPDEIIFQALDGINQSYSRVVGDIFTRYYIQSDEQQNMVQSIIDQTIELIVANIRDSYLIEKNNRKLSAWVQVYGDFNSAGLRQHPILKTREKKWNPMEFNMNY